MLEKITQIIQNRLVYEITLGINTALIVVFLASAVVFALMALSASLWWLIGFCACSIACGFFSGISNWLYSLRKEVLIDDNW